MAANQQENLSYRFTQDSFGTHVIQDKSGNEITIDCRTLTMSDIRELLNGLGGIMQSISSHTWDREFK
jgi:hypothetical protein